MKRLSVALAAVLVLMLAGIAFAQSTSGSSAYPQQTGSTNPPSTTDQQQVNQTPSTPPATPSATPTEAPSSASSATASTTDPSSAAMPKTASPLPLIGMLGLAGLGLGLVVRRTRRTA